MSRSDKAKGGYRTGLTSEPHQLPAYFDSLARPSQYNLASKNARAHVKLALYCRLRCLRTELMSRSDKAKGGYRTGLTSELRVDKGSLSSRTSCRLTSTRSLARVSTTSPARTPART
jgi:hypothetical protein